MIKKFLCLSVLIYTCTLYPYKEHKPIATHYRYKEPSHKIVITSWDTTRLHLAGILFMGGSVATGCATLNVISHIAQDGFSEDSVGYFIIFSGLTAGLFATGVYCFNKAERMY